MASAPRQMGRVQADPHQMAEEAREPGAARLGQRRGEQRGEVGAQMLSIAGAEEDNIDPGLVAHKAIGRVDDALGTAITQLHLDAPELTAWATGLSTAAPPSLLRR